MAAYGDAVGWLVELDSREALLVTAFRNAAVALGQDRPDYWTGVENNLAGIAGREGARAALAAFERVMYTLGCHARSEVRFHAPECPCLGRDELAFLRIRRHVAAGSPGAARAAAAELVTTAAVDTLVSRLGEFDAGLAAASGWAPAHRLTPGQPGPSERVH